MFDIIIIGSGPAGISAGIYATRAGAKTLVIGKDDGVLVTAKKIDNYFGTDGTVSGEELLKNGKKQYVSLGGELVVAEALSIENMGSFYVKTTAGEFESKAVILAVGRKKSKKTIGGEDEFLGRGVSRCAVCDGFFFRNKKIGVLGAGEYAVSEARQLLPFTKDITLFTNGKPCNNNEFYVNTDKLEKVFGEQKLQGVINSEGDKILLDGLFIADETPGAFELALKLGLKTENGYISTDKNGSTNFSGIFAAGDCIGGFNQLSTAVGEGAVAGQRAAEFIRKQESKNDGI